MAYLNENYLKLRAGYLFPEIARRVREFCEGNPEATKRLIRCGIGDVTEPLPRAAINAMKRGVDDLGKRETFRGYGPEQGYEFLRSTIAQHDYRDRNIEIADDEIFVSDGSKCDCGYILDILGDQNKVAVPDPVYPVYVDTNVMAGRSGRANADGSYEGILYLPCTVENGFVPEPPREHVDLVYLCFPNNPTGTVTNFHVGSSTRANTKRCCSSTLPMKRIFHSQIFRIQFSKFRARASAQWSYAVFPRTAVSPVCAAGSLSCQGHYSREQRAGDECLSTSFGVGAGVRRRTA